MRDELKPKMSLLMYWLIKDAARDSFVEFIEERCNMTMEEWEEIRQILIDEFEIKPYL